MDGRGLSVSEIPFNWNAHLDIHKLRVGYLKDGFEEVRDAELIRTGRDKQLTNPGRATGFRSARLIPAVEYLQSQRARTMMMMKLAEATADVDVYLVPANNAGGGGGRGRGAEGAGRARSTKPSFLRSRRRIRTRPASI